MLFLFLLPGEVYACCRSSALEMVFMQAAAHPGLEVEVTVQYTNLWRTSMLLCLPLYLTWSEEGGVASLLANGEARLFARAPHAYWQAARPAC
jgi:hypothetical protein